MNLVRGPMLATRLRDAAEALREDPRTAELPVIHTLYLASGWRLDVRYDRRSRMGEFRLRNPQDRVTGSIRFEPPDIPGLLDGIAVLAEAALGEGDD